MAIKTFEPDLARNSQAVARSRTLNRFSGHDLQMSIFPALVVGALVAAYEESVAFMPIGMYIVYGFVASIFLLALFDFRRAYYISIAAIALSAPMARNLNELLGSNNTDTASSFFTIHTTGLGSFTAVIFLIVGLAGIAVWRALVGNQSIQLSNVARDVLILIIGLVGLQLAGSILFALNAPYFDLRRFASDARAPVLIALTLLILGYIFSNSERKEMLAHAKLLMFICIAGAFKGIGLVVADLIHGQAKLVYGNQPYIMVPLLFAFWIFYDWKRPWSRAIFTLVIFIGAFRISRGGIAFLGLEFLMCLFLISLIDRHKGVFRSKFGGLLVGAFGLVLLAVFGLQMLDSRLFGFLVYKASFFGSGLLTGELPKSPMVRWIEFQNIWNDGVDFLPYLVFGKGFGGAIVFDNPPMPYQLNFTDYDTMQLRSGIIYRPHLFINFVLLKGGLIYLALYLAMPIYLFIKSLSLFPQYKTPEHRFLLAIIYFASLYMIHLYWQITVTCFFAIIIMLIANMNGNRSQRLT